MQFFGGNNATIGLLCLIRFSGAIAHLASLVLQPMSFERDDARESIDDSIVLNTLVCF